MDHFSLGEGELLLALLLGLLPLAGLLGGVRLLDIFRTPLRGLGEPERDELDLPRFRGGARPLRGETDLDRDRTGLRIGERVRRRGGGDLLGGLLARLGGERLLAGIGERLRSGLPRPLLGETRAGDLCLRGTGDGDLLLGETILRRGGGGGVSPRR